MLPKYNSLKSNLNHKYKEKLKEYRFWNKIEKNFIRKKGKTFTLSFPHPDYDDEFRIEAIAHSYGYKIVDEKLEADRSVYTFEKV